jgi:hypothetical protein
VKEQATCALRTASTDRDSPDPQFPSGPGLANGGASQEHKPCGSQGTAVYRSSFLQYTEVTNQFKLQFTYLHRKQTPHPPIPTGHTT